VRSGAAADAREDREYFIEGLVVGDTFVFGGEVVRYEQLSEDVVYVSRAMTPSQGAFLMGASSALDYLAERGPKLPTDKRAWNTLPDQVRDWLSLQAAFVGVPACANCGGNFRAPTRLPRLLSL